MIDKKKGENKQKIQTVKTTKQISPNFIILIRYKFYMNKSEGNLTMKKIIC